MANQETTGARPGDWSVSMTWSDLLFAHWPFPPELVRPLIPAELELDTWDGRAWIGVVPFRMSEVRPRLVPTFGLASDFPELNVRTYVSHRGRSGVWFFSLDAASRLAVRAARWWFKLPYHHAHMTVTREGGVRYRSRRDQHAAPPAAFDALYAPEGPTFQAAEGTLDHFVTERYALFSRHPDGRIGYGAIRHGRWPLRPAWADIRVNTMLEPLGLRLPLQPPLIHFVRRLDVVAWSVEWMGEPA